MPASGEVGLNRLAQRPWLQGNTAPVGKPLDEGGQDLDVLRTGPIWIRIGNDSTAPWVTPGGPGVRATTADGKLLPSILLSRPAGPIARSAKFPEPGDHGQRSCGEG